jgi:hypothetical protein
MKTFDQKASNELKRVFMNVVMYARAIGEREEFEDGVVYELGEMRVSIDRSFVRVMVNVDYDQGVKVESVVFAKEQGRVWGSRFGMNRLKEEFGDDVFLFALDQEFRVYMVKDERFVILKRDGRQMVSHPHSFKFKGMKEMGRLFQRAVNFGYPVEKGLAGILIGLNKREKKEFLEGMESEAEKQEIKVYLN